MKGGAVDPYEYSGTTLPQRNQQGGGGAATAALVLGLLSLVAWVFPFIGLLASISGLILAASGMKTASRSTAFAGLILCVIGLIFAVGYWIYSVPVAHELLGPKFQEFLGGGGEKPPSGMPD